jgi:prophage regulatory protein
MPTTETAPLQMLRMPEVIQRTGLSRSTIYALVADGKFPRQIKVSENTAAWLEHEIDAYLIDRIAERDQQADNRESA